MVMIGRREVALSVVAALALLVAAAPVAAQDGGGGEGEQELRTTEDVEAFLDTWSGSADELQAKYESLDPESRALIDSLVELWSIEGGLGVQGGFGQTVSGEGEGFGIFRLEASFGVLWPVGEYSLPIYYAVDDVPWPWGAGFQVWAGVDNLDAFFGGAGFRWAYDYVGTTPHVDVGPVVRYDEGEVNVGGRVAVGYGNILLQGYVSGEYYALDEQLWLVTGGLRLPWLLFLPSTWEIVADYL